MFRLATPGRFVSRIKFSIADEGSVFSGWTDGTYWNGFINVEVSPRTRDAIVTALIEAARTNAGHELGPDETEEATGGIEGLPIYPGRRISLANGYTTREASCG